MIQFDQWLGFLVIMVILTIGFWIMFFLVSLLPYWIIGNLKNHYREYKANKKQAEENSSEHDIVH